MDTPITPRLVVKVVAFLLCMLLVLGAVGAFVGWPELSIWFALLVAGIVLIVRRHDKRV